MSRNLRLQPKLKTKITLNTALKTLALGGAIFVVVFFYLNIGLSSSGKAGETSTTSSGVGNWSDEAYWDNGIPDESIDKVVIKEKHEVTISSNINFDGSITVYGTIIFENGKLRMDESSQIIVSDGGGLISTHRGSSDQITIGSSKWKGEEITDVVAPNVLCSTGEGCTSILPISLLFFELEIVKGPAVLLKWRSASEENNSFYTIERSLNSRDFEEIATIDGAGNSTQPIDYSYIDNNPVKGKAYYRLIQTDFDGTSEYLKVLFCSLDEDDKTLLVIESVSPNPFSNDLHIDFRSSSGEVQVNVFDKNGRIVHSNQTNASLGINRYNFDGRDLMPGVYLLSLQQGGINKTHKIYKR